MAVRHTIGPRSATSIAGHPVYATPVPFPIVCFIVALGTHILFQMTGALMWQNFSAWLRFVGLVMGGLTGLFEAVDLLAQSGKVFVRFRTRRC